MISSARSTIFTGSPCRARIPLRPRPWRLPVSQAAQPLHSHKILSCRGEYGTGPPSAICFRNVGTTLPRLPNTFPKLTAMNRVTLPPYSLHHHLSYTLAHPHNIHGVYSLVVDIITNRSCTSAACATLRVRTRCSCASSGLPPSAEHVWAAA